MAAVTMCEPLQGQKLGQNLIMSRGELGLDQNQGFGPRLERAIANAGLRKKDFAARMGVHPAVVSQWLTEGNPTAETLARMSAILNTSVDWLIHGPAPSRRDLTADEIEKGAEVAETEGLSPPAARPRRKRGGE